MSDRLQRYLRFLRPDVRADADEEIRFHIEMRERDLVSRGMSPGEARARAEVEFGDVRTIRAQVVSIDERRQRRRGRREQMADLVQDLRLVMRGLRRSPGFTSMAVACIALGVCVTTTIFAAVNGVLLRPLPFAKSDELVALYSRWRAKNETGVNISFPDYVSWRDENRTFSAMGIWTWTTVALSGDGEAERLDAANVSANLFPLMGVQPILGRHFTANEERPGEDKVILLGYDLWTRRYQGDRAIVDRQIMVEGVPYTVVGVMPPRFNFPERGQAWVPFAVDPATEEHGNRMYAGAIGRLKPGVTLEQARADMAAISARLEKAFPKDNVGWDVDALTLRDDLVGDLRRPLEVFLVAVGFVLLIACANVANLMLARGTARQQETALRVALGARRGRIIRQVLTESMVIAAVGGVVGVVLARFGVRLLELAFPNGTPYFISVGLDWTVAIFAVLLTAGTGVMFGLAPALSATHVELQRTLREGSGGGDGRGRARMRSALVVSEVALSVVLLIGAALLLRSYRALITTNLGFDEQGILSARLTLPEARYASSDARRAFWERLYSRVAAIPGVELVGSAQGIPFSGWQVQAEMTVDGGPARPPGTLVIHYQNISPDYFRAIGVPIVKGRGFTQTDRDSTLRIGIINEILAKREIPDGDPIGKRIKFGSADETHEWYTIVGVARDFRHYRLPEPMGPAVYFPELAEPNRSQTLAIRTRLADPLTLVPSLRRVVREIDPDLPLYSIQTFEQAVQRSLWRQRFQGQVLSIFAALALLLSTVGIYGIITWSVSRRTRELGVRMALGATRSGVVRLVLREGARLAITGVFIGLATAFVLTRLLNELLYGVKTLDPVSFISVPVVLLIVAAFSSYIPARRAARVSPVVAMKAE